MIMSREFFDALRLAGLEDIRDDYSGRGMYGARCFSCGDISAFYSTIHRFYTSGKSQDEIDLLHEAELKFTRDDMGLGSVFYTSQLTVEPENDDMDDEDEEEDEYDEEEEEDE
jgi:hypothetical protein